MWLFLSKTQKLFISFKIYFSCCFGFRGNLEFPDLLQKKFYNINFWSHCYLHDGEEVDREEVDGEHDDDRDQHLGNLTPRPKLIVQRAIRRVQPETFHHLAGADLGSVHTHTPTHPHTHTHNTELFSA